MQKINVLKTTRPLVLSLSDFVSLVAFFHAPLCQCVCTTETKVQWRTWGKKKTRKEKENKRN